MLVQDSIAINVLNLIYKASRERIGVKVRRHDLMALTSIDPSVLETALDELVCAGFVDRTPGDERVAINYTGFGQIRAFPNTYAG